MYDLRLRWMDVTLTPADIVANTSAEQLFTVPGVELGDVVIACNKPTAQAGLYYGGARVSADGQIGITFGNFTGSTITPTAGQVYRIAVMKRQP